jgi:hypothetical protein
MEPQSILIPFCQAIAIYEGATEPGTRPYRNCNPGDLRWPYGKPYPWGATGIDDAYFLIFPNFQTGFNALVGMVERAASGHSRIYRPDMTIVEFFNEFAPSSDNNNPDKYAEWVGEHIGVDPTVYKISNLIA